MRTSTGPCDGERVIRDIKLDLHTKLQSLSLDYFNLTPVGQHTMLLNNGANSIYRCLSLGFSDAVKEPFTIVATLTTLFVLDPELALLGLFFAPPRAAFCGAGAGGRPANRD